MIKGFREFVFRGNVVDLAVGIAVGVAFTALVASVIKALVEPVVGWVLSFIGGSDGVGGTITLSPGYEINVALLIGAFITFFVTLAVLYFAFVLPLNKYRSMKGQGALDTRSPEVRVLEEIRDLMLKQAGEESGARTADVMD